VLNRSSQRAAELGGPFGAVTGGMDELSDRLAEADVVVTSTAAHEPILTRRTVSAALARRADRPMLIIDIAVPRDVAADVAEIPGVHLYNIDDLSAAVEKTVHRRREHLDACETIVAAHVREFDQWQAAREVAPTIEALRKKIRAVADEELADACNKLSTHDDCEQDRLILERVLHRVVRRFLHDPTEKLRSNGGGSESARMYAATLRKLFNLDDVE
jgi:glutamyl-tRNA reductase